jgi:predicted permease
MNLFQSLRNLLRRKMDLSEELESHVRMAIADRVARGESPEEASRSAKREFGNLPLIADVTRERWGWLWLERLLQDLGFAIRQLRRSPGFTITAVLTLGLGIGSVVAVFSVVYSVLLRPYGFAGQGQLVVWHEVVEEWKGFLPSVPANYKHYVMFKTRAHSVANAAILQPGAFFVSPVGNGGTVHPTLLEGLSTSSELFPVLGIAPALGRNFLPLESEAGHDGEVILGWATWQRMFHGDADALGKSILVDGKLHTVIGVLPRTFRFPPIPVLSGLTPPYGSTEVYQIFMPLVVGEGTKQADTNDFNYLVVARLRPGVSPQAAQVEMNGLETANRIAGHLPIHVRAVVTTLTAEANSSISTALWFLLAATGGVLLIVCVNLANLQLARGVARERDVALRAALGAGRARLVQNALAESLVLALAGGAVGIGLAFAVVRLTRALAPQSLPRINEIAISWPALLAAVALAGSTALLFGILPALASMRVEPQRSLRAASGSVAGTRKRALTRRSLVACEVALSVALLAIAGLAGRSFTHLMTDDWHFSADHVLLAEVHLLSPEYGNAWDPTEPGAATAFVRRNAFLQEALRRLRALPGVIDAGVTTEMPLTGQGNGQSLERPERPIAPELRPMADQRMVSPGYMTTMQIPLVSGRNFDERDIANPQTAILSEKAAKAGWPDINPLGHKLIRWGKQFTIIGITADARINDLKQDVSVLYLPINADPQKGDVFVIRSKAPAQVLTPLVRQALWSIDPEVAIPKIVSMDKQVSESVAAERLQAALFTGFGIAALLLAALGVYGVLAYTASLRRREFGVRLAMGSPRAALVRLVLLEALRPLAIGLAAGLGLALLAGRWMNSLLYETAGNDPVVLGGSAILLLTTAILAALLPARRASTMDPLAVLRES